ncbi:hypothetical protein LOK74_05905 [Brevibacillus humidisoli]|uniref:hypothetical protein n=1 Tax=Brevibacillus humidisoli TaxID=2895522 RepID=UPI001E52C95C|nr:hypothetical protein [Brevibacillus humidisoli]UFJ42032.1 hypothetical protein LOK74_05905 [Brevibacillus humidisoli]
MEQDLSVIVDLVHEAYPNLPILLNLQEWEAESISPPYAFVQIKELGETGHTLTSHNVLVDTTVILLHEEVNSVYTAIPAEPIRSLLQSKQFAYRGQTDGRYIEIERDSFRVRSKDSDRTEITFRFTYTAAIPKEATEKIHVFETEEVWHR